MPEQALTIIPASPEVLSLKVPDSPLVAQAKALQIKTDGDVITAKDYRGQLKAREKFIMEDVTGPQFAVNIKNAHSLHKSLVAAAKVFTDPINDAIGIIDKGLGSFEMEKSRLKDESDRIAREEQDRERQKIMDAAQAKIDRAMKSTGKIETQIEAMQLIVDDLLASEEARTLAARQIEVLRLKLENNQDRAQEIQKTAERAMDALPVASPAAVNYERTKGVSVQKVVDASFYEIPGSEAKKLLIKLVAEGKAPDVILDVNIGALTKLVRMGVVFPAEAVKVTDVASYRGRG